MNKIGDGHGGAFLMARDDHASHLAEESSQHAAPGDIIVGRVRKTLAIQKTAR